MVLSANYRDVIMSIFKYFSMMRASALPAWYQRELSEIKAMRFRFQEKRAPDDYATFMSEHMAWPVPRDQIITAPTLVEEWDEADPVNGGEREVRERRDQEERRDHHGQRDRAGERIEQDHDADTIEVTALLAAQASVNSVDVDAPACLFAPFVVSYPDQPAPHLLGLPPATAGPPRRPLYLTFCSFWK